MDNTSANIDLIRSHVDIIILKPLETQDRYGYEILKEIDTNSNGLFNLKQPTMYSCLKRLEKQGYINSYLGSESNGAQRRYYSLTQQGHAFLDSQRAEWEFVRTVLSGLVSDVDFDSEKDIKPFDPSKYRPLTKRTRSEDDPQNVQVVEKVVYVKSEPEPAPPPTPEQIKESLSEQDIEDIVKEYLETHPDQALTNCDNEELVSEDNLDTYIENIDASSEENAPDESYLTDYNTLYSSEAVEEDVALDTDSDYTDDAYDDIEDDEPNSELLRQLTAPQENNIEDADEDNVIVINNDETSESAAITMQEDYDNDDEEQRFMSYSDDDLPNDEDSPSCDSDDLGYSYTTFEPSKPIKLDGNPVDESDNALFDYSRSVDPSQDSNNDTVNVLSALDTIYSSNQLSDEVPDMADSDVIDDNTMRITYDVNAGNSSGAMTLNDMRNMLDNQDIKIKPYKRTSAIEYFENNYYYYNRTARDTSIIMFVLFFIESLVTYFVLEPKFAIVDFGYLVLTWVIASIFPIIYIVKWAIGKDYKKQTKVSLGLAMMLSLIIALNLALIIFLVGFFAFGADYSEINTMVLPILTPLAFLINIPLSALVYYILYRTKRYNLR